MPTIGWGHSQYWQIQAVPPPVVASPLKRYPVWQTSVIVGGGFGVMQVIWEMWVQTPKAEKG